MKPKRFKPVRKTWSGRGPGKPPFHDSWELSPWNRDFSAARYFAHVTLRRGKRFIHDLVWIDDREIIPISNPDEFYELIKVRLESSQASMIDAAPDRKERVRARRIKRYLRRR